MGGLNIGAHKMYNRFLTHFFSRLQGHNYCCCDSCNIDSYRKINIKNKPSNETQKNTTNGAKYEAKN